MTDTQWPTFEVFQQDAVGKPHRHVGAVHAPDAELALMNARDVFVRRPACHSLWVVPTAMVFSRTAQELEDGRLQDVDIGAPAGMPEPYFVFQKQTQRTSDRYVTYVGTVEAPSPAEAIRRAAETFGEQSPWVWWVCPARAVTQSRVDDAASMFKPALSKEYRHPRQYHGMGTGTE